VKAGSEFAAGRRDVKLSASADIFPRELCDSKLQSQFGGATSGSFPRRSLAAWRLL
jgi:hypothetical protein